MTCTAPLTIAQSGCGMWMRTLMWKLCKCAHTHTHTRTRVCCSDLLDGVLICFCFFTVLLLRFGHQDAITGLDCLGRERCVTAGGRDRTVRVWKIPEETQLVFHGHE